MLLATISSLAHGPVQVPTGTPTHLVIVLPVYNEAENLEPLVESFSVALPHGAYQIVVVDDGSDDGTRGVLERLASSNPIHILTHTSNQGLGTTIFDGLSHACELASPDGIVVTMDADQTHPASIIPQLAKAMETGCDMVIASRYRRGSQVFGLSPFRKVLSLGASLLFQTLLPTQDVRDYTCGYRAYRASSLRIALAHYGRDLVGGSGFECMAGILFKFRALGFRFAEVPFILHYEKKLGASKMRVAHTIVSTLKLAAEARRAGYDHIAPARASVSGGES